MVLYCEHCSHAADGTTVLWQCWRCELNDSTEKTNELLQKISDLLEEWLK